MTICEENDENHLQNEMPPFLPELMLPFLNDLDPEILGGMSLEPEVTQIFFLAGLTASLGASVNQPFPLIETFRTLSLEVAEVFEKAAQLGQIVLQIDSSEQLTHERFMELLKIKYTFPYELQFPPNPKILFIGPPDSGKSTMAELISESFGLTHVDEYGKLADTYELNYEMIAEHPEFVLFPTILKFINYYMQKKSERRENTMDPVIYDEGAIGLLTWLRLFYTDENASNFKEVMELLTGLILMSSEGPHLVVFLPTSWEEVDKRRRAQGWEGSRIGSEMWPRFDTAYQWLFNVIFPLIDAEVVILEESVKRQDKQATAQERITEFLARLPHKPHP